MSTQRNIDTRKNIKVVTANTFITACGLANTSLKARKLLYLAISQCKKTDTDFYEYSITVPAFAELMGISPTHVYEEADALTDELMGGFIRVELGNDYEKYNFFSKCKYSKKDYRIYFKLNKDMTDFLLELKGTFTQPLLDDFMRMKSPYSMAIWHLMQREMHSKKPGIINTIEFDLSLAELREVTGTQNKLKQVGQFKERVLDKALREIDDNCGVKITYTNIKEFRTVTGFHFTATSPFHVDEENISQESKDKVAKFKLEQKAKSRPLTPAEREEYDRLVAKSEQMNLFDI